MISNLRISFSNIPIKPESRYNNDFSLKLTFPKLIDFGSSCFETEKLYTYIQSRFYRAPEIILGLNYNTQIDMWSFGCLLFELYTGQPIFPGESEHDQLLCMMEILGAPEEDLILVRKTSCEYSYNSNRDHRRKSNSLMMILNPN